MQTGYYTTHYTNVRNSIFLGIPVPGPRNAGKLFEIYFLILVSIDAVVFVLYTIQIFQVTSMVKICVDFIGDFTVLYGFVFTVYVAANKTTFKGIMREFDDIMFCCINDPLDPKKTFYDRMLSDYKYIQMYSRASVPFIFCSAVGFFSINIFRSLSLFGMDGQKLMSVDIWFPNSMESPYYEISQILSMLGIVISACQKIAMECFVLSLLTLLCTYLDHLNATAINIFETEMINDRVQQKSNTIHSSYDVSQQDHLSKNVQVDINIKNWSKIHQKTLRLSRELTDLLSPLLAFYLVNITALVAVNIFTISLGEINMSEFFSLCNYSTMTALSLFLMCHFGTKLTYKSIQASQPAFWKCFEHGGGATKNNYSSLKIIFQRSMKPVIVSPFRSSSFELSYTSFISFVWSIISFYLAIKKIKEHGIA